ncbi:11029_t:CDS:2 [Paraglomus brasilianum]|uniref:11029_t:CDS:1 n=1 Tax=Paraglomus brasilianum TaxID=144538 RepID=A0A9N9DBF2_9GLOM|nr:11029_t:CDS:2 [Paraglomus brasilianum]
MSRFVNRSSSRMLKFYTDGKSDRTSNVFGVLDKLRKRLKAKKRSGERAEVKESEEGDVEAEKGEGKTAEDGDMPVRFQKRVLTVCKNNMANSKQVGQCMGGLFSRAQEMCTRNHGTGKNNSLSLCEIDWAPNEILALGTIFRYYSVRYIYKDKGAEQSPFPFDLQEW